MVEQIPTIEVPSYQTEPAEYEEVQLTQGTWNIFPILPIYRLILRFSEGADGRITQTERGLIVVIESAQASVFLQADCKKDTTCSVGYTKNAFFKLGALSGSGSGGRSYTFNAPLNENGGVVDLDTSNQLIVQNGVLTLALKNNVDFMNLQYQINQLKYPQFDFLEINWTPDVFKQGTFSLGEISPTAVGNIPLRNGDNAITTFGTLKNANYTDNDLCYNDTDGFFYIGKNNKLINLYTNGLLNSKLASGKYTIQFTCEVTSFGDSWKQPLYMQVNGTFSSDIANTAYKDNSNRLEFGDSTSSSPSTKALYAFNWNGGITETRSVNLPNLPVNTKISGVAVFNGTTTTVYARQAGQSSYVNQGTMNATPPNGGNLRAIGFVRGANTLTCASIKIYELRFWAGVALSESEVQQLVKTSIQL